MPSSSPKSSWKSYDDWGDWANNVMVPAGILGPEKPDDGDGWRKWDVLDRARLPCVMPDTYPCQSYDMWGDFRVGRPVPEEPSE
jgi:hypothetical protein